MTPHHEHLQNWLQKTHLGQYVIQQENHFFQAAFSQITAQRVLQIGLPECYTIAENHAFWVRQNHALPADVLAQKTTIWRDNAFDAIMLPHYLEQPHSQTLLTELTRIVQPFGCLVLTAFNPHSLWRYQRDLPMKHAVSLPELKSWLPPLGWKIEQCQLMNYLPPIHSPDAMTRWRFMESLGARCFPNYAAVYGLILRKHVTPLRGATDEIDDVLVSGDVALGLTRSQN